MGEEPAPEYSAQGNVTSPTGLISVYAFPMERRGTSYEASCSDVSFPINRLFIMVPLPLRDLFDRFLGAYGGITYAPCVIGKHAPPSEQPEKSFYTARLLVPPDTKKDPKLFIPGLVIPDLRISDIDASSVTFPFQPRGYVMYSEYAGGKKFYIAGDKMPERLRELSFDIESPLRFHGMIEQNKRNKHYPSDYPSVYITDPPINSKDNANVFGQNSEQLRELEKEEGNALFWWDWLE